MSAPVDGLPTGEALLVTAVNGGGVFHVGHRGVVRLSSVDTTGIAPIAGGWLLARQADGIAELRQLRADPGRVVLSHDSLDLHDLHVDAGRLFVVCTEINAVLELDGETFVETGRWMMPGERDAQHVNSFCLHAGRLLASRFGDFRDHRGYKGRTAGAGEVVDLVTGEVVISGLSQPHSLQSREGLLWLCDSEASVLRAYDGTREVRSLSLPGYARGLAFGASHAYVGLSRSRNVADDRVATATIVCIDLASWTPVATLALPTDEIYDIVIVSDTRDAVDALRDAALADALLEIDGLRHARNALAGHAHDRHVEIGRLVAALASERQSHGATVEALERERRVAARRQAAIAEEAVWARRLDEHADALAAAIEACRRDGDARAAAHAAASRAQSAAIEALLQERDVQSRLLAEHAAVLATIRGSRSWRWTRPLRRAEPASPPMPPTPAAVALPAAVEPPGGPPALPDRPLRSALAIHDLAFAPHEHPLVSIVVTAYGHFDETLACLHAICRLQDQATYEVILLEDASSEGDMDRFGTVPGLRYHRHPANLGFLRSANAGVGLARGEFVVFLNNDTEVLPGWLDGLLSTFDLFHECGLAGSQLVYPDGRLQESGGIVWSDGDACNYGRGDPPALERHRVVRETDYVSGASIMVRRDLLRALGGFDDRYAPAYYEDTDLAFRVRQAGYRVYVQPRSQVIHHEGLSHGTDPSASGKAGQARNREVFLERWRDELARAQLAPGEHPFLARDRAQLARMVLVVDRYPPQPDRDAGSKAIWQLMRVLFLRGFRVKFWSDAGGEDPAYADALRVHGIEAHCEERDGAFSAWIAEHGPYFDHVVLSRPVVADACIDAVRRSSAATVVYYGHDIHAQRIARHAALEGDRVLHAQSAHLREVEQRLWRLCDLVLYPAMEETREVLAYQASVGATARAATIPLFAFESVSGVAATAGPATRDEVLFVGGFGHVPNADGVLWFVREVWPSVRDAHPGVSLRLVGAGPTEAVQALAGPDVIVAGQVSEVELVAAYQRARVVVAPLRFGAGTKGKVVEALRFGVPCVTTAVGAQGLTDVPCLAVADAPEPMARRIGALLRDEVLWWQASEAGIAWVREHFSVEAVWRPLSQVMDPSPYPDVDARRRAIAAACGAGAVAVD